MALALDILLSALALAVLADLVTGLVRGQLRLLDGDRNASPTLFWTYAGVEAVLVVLVASLWI
jgi:hypothetical protein